MREFASTAEMLGTLRPVDPVYCVHTDLYRAAAMQFLDGFPGHVLYAVKANNSVEVVRALAEAGIRYFDCASLPEIELVNGIAPGSECYFMTPVRIPGAAADAQRRFGVRHFMIDDASALEPLCREIDPGASVVFVRMAVSHGSAAQDLSSKFGAPPDAVPGLLRSVADAGAEAALAFNVGSGVTSPAAYEYALGIARDVLRSSSVPVRLLDIGGGFPIPYPGYEVPPLEDYFSVIRDAAASMPLAEGGELLAEPGRALSAPGLSAVTRVLLRKDGRAYLNDGMYGAFWELRFKGHKRYAARAWRGSQPLDGPTRRWQLYGPTCDSTDVLPEPIELPEALDVGDYVQFDAVGAYSLSGRTDFNGFGNYAVARISGERA